MSSHESSNIGSRQTLATRAAVWLATGLGIGLVTPAPGTVAGLWGTALAAGISTIASPAAHLWVIVALVLVAIPICTMAARGLGASGDPGAIVLDEIVALPIVFVGVPGMSWPLMIAGYLLFRVCDIAKIGLVSSAEKLPEGWGIMADDCVAAVMACLLLHGTIWLDGWLGLDWLVVNA